MFKIFKRRKDKPALTYGVMQYLSNAVERRQRKVADYLNGKTKSFSRKKWVVCLLVFCGSMGGIATSILIASVHEKHNNEWKQSSISIPSSILQQGREWDSLKMLEEIYAHRKDSVFKKQINKH